LVRQVDNLDELNAYIVNDEDEEDYFGPRIDPKTEFVIEYGSSFVVHNVELSGGGQSLSQLATTYASKLGLPENSLSALNFVSGGDVLLHEYVPTPGKFINATFTHSTKG
jgi:hypothetical protein